MKSQCLAGLLLLGLSGSLYAGMNSKEVTPVVEVPLVEDRDNRDYTFGLKAGTLGVGMDISTPIFQDTALRLNLNGLQYNRIEEIDGISYDGTLDFFSVGMLLDYFPFESTGFRLTGGAYYNANKFTGIAKPIDVSNVEINGVTYGIDDVGRLDTEITFNRIAPYVGLGWGNDVRFEGWGFNLDVGAMYQGTPNAVLDVHVNNSMLESQIRNDVEAEKQTLLDDIEQYKIYPVIMVGVDYTF